MNEFLIQIPAALISIFALVYAIRAHKLNLHVNNEHILYEQKMESAKEVLYAISDLINSIQSGFELYQYLVDHNESTATSEELFDAADDIDNKADELRNVMITSAVVLPKKTTKQFDEFIDLVYSKSSMVELKLDEIHQYEFYIDELLKQFEKIAKSFKNDFHVGILNKFSDRRLKKISRKTQNS